MLSEAVALTLWAAVMLLSLQNTGNSETALPEFPRPHPRPDCRDIAHACNTCTHTIRFSYTTARV